MIVYKYLIRLVRGLFAVSPVAAKILRLMVVYNKNYQRLALLRTLYPL